MQVNRIRTISNFFARASLMRFVALVFVMLSISMTSADLQAATAAPFHAPVPVKQTAFVFTDCATNTAAKELEVCTSGRPNAKLRVAFMGDSHTRQYFPALFKLADKYNWQVTVISKSGCPVLGTKPFPAVSDIRFCKEWNKSRESYLASVKPFALIINSNSSFLTRGNAEIAKAYKQTIAKQLARGTKVVAIFDNAKPDPGVAKCYKTFGAAVNANCSVSKKIAFTSKDAQPASIRSLPGVTVLDFSSAYCGISKTAPSLCPPLINGIKVYRDNSHISSTFAATLQSRIDAGLPSFAKRVN